MRRRIVVLIVLGALVAAVAAAQFRQRGRQGFSQRADRYATLEDFDGTFQFCRVVFRQGAGRGGNWSVDYPRADENLSIRLSELTKTSVGMGTDDLPNHLLVNLTDPVFFHCPFIMMTEVGSAFLSDQEAANLRDYLLRGGFLWADDFWGEYAWEIWESQLRKALPSGQFPIVDLPIDHPMFHSLMSVKRIPQIPSINFWAGSGGRTSERGADSAQPQVRAIFDDRGRIMVLMTHNTDFGDAFEREGDNHQYFLRFAPAGYAFGVNALIYSMTH